MVGIVVVGANFVEENSDQLLDDYDTDMAIDLEYDFRCADRNCSRGLSSDLGYGTPFPGHISHRDIPVRRGQKWTCTILLSERDRGWWSFRQIPFVDPSTALLDIPSRQWLGGWNRFPDYEFP